MKTNLTRLLFFRRIFYGLTYLSIKAQALLRADNIFQGILLISCLLGWTLFILSLFNSWNIMETSTVTIKYLEGLDCPMDLIDNQSEGKEFKLPKDNGYPKFLKLFVNDYINHYKLPKELENSYYMNDLKSNFRYNTQTSLDVRDRNLYDMEALYLDYQYMYKSAYFQQISSQVDKLSSLLKDMQAYRASILTSINSVHINTLGDINKI